MSLICVQGCWVFQLLQGCDNILQWFNTRNFGKSRFPSCWSLIVYLKTLLLFPFLFYFWHMSWPVGLCLICLSLPDSPVMPSSTYHVVPSGWCQVRSWLECLKTKWDSKDGTEVPEQTHGAMLGSTVCWRNVGCLSILLKIFFLPLVWTWPFAF